MSDRFSSELKKRKRKKKSRMPIQVPTACCTSDPDDGLLQQCWQLSMMSSRTCAPKKQRADWLRLNNDFTVRWSVLTWINLLPLRWPMGPDLHWRKWCCWLWRGLNTRGGPIRNNNTGGDIWNYSGTKFHSKIGNPFQSNPNKKHLWHLSVTALIQGISHSLCPPRQKSRNCLTKTNPKCFHDLKRFFIGLCFLMGWMVQFPLHLKSPPDMLLQ